MLTLDEASKYLDSIRTSIKRSSVLENICVCLKHLFSNSSAQLTIEQQWSF